MNGYALVVSMLLVASCSLSDVASAQSSYSRHLDLKLYSQYEGKYIGENQYENYWVRDSVQQRSAPVPLAAGQNTIFFLNAQNQSWYTTGAQLQVLGTYDARRWRVIYWRKVPGTEQWRDVTDQVVNYRKYFGQRAEGYFLDIIPRDSETGPVFAVQVIASGLVKRNDIFQLRYKVVTPRTEDSVRPQVVGR